MRLPRKVYRSTSKTSKEGLHPSHTKSRVETAMGAVIHWSGWDLPVMTVEGFLVDLSFSLDSQEAAAMDWAVSPR